MVQLVHVPVGGNEVDVLAAVLFRVPIEGTDYEVHRGRGSPYGDRGQVVVCPLGRRTRAPEQLVHVQLQTDVSEEVDVLPRWAPR